MTIEEKAAAYDAIAKRNDAMAHLLAELLYAIRSGCYNKWDLTGGNHPENLELGPCKGWKDWQESLSKCGYYHLSQLVRVMIDTEEDIDNFPKGKADLADVIANTEWKATIKKLEEANDTPRMGWSVRRCAAELYLLIGECPIGEGLPGDEGSIYRDAFKALMLAMFEQVGVDPKNTEQVVDLIHEFHPDIRFEKEEKA